MKHSNLDLKARRYTNLVVFRRENHTHGLIGLLKGNFGESSTLHFREEQM